MCCLSVFHINIVHLLESRTKLLHMKNLLLIFSMLFMLSCGTNTTKKNDAKADAEKAKKENVKKADDAAKNECEVFLEDFEKWVVELESTYKKVKADPSDKDSEQKLLRANENLVEWQNKWDSLGDCINNEEYENRMLDLEDRVNKLTSM